MSGGRVALVTGASRGIGAGIAAHLAANGWYVAGTATSEDGARRIDEALAGQGTGVAMDVADDASVEHALEAIRARCGDPQALVNNAGVARDNLLMRMKPEEWSAVMDTNVGALYRLSRRLLRPMMKARWGRIVNMSSVVARMGNPGQSNYAASKAAVEGFTRALALEVGSRGITVNAVAPGFIETDMTAGLDADQRGALAARIPVGRLGSAEDVAAAVAYLLSDAAAYVTGETLHVNGGLYPA